MQEVVIKPGQLELSTKQNLVISSSEIGSSVAMAVYDKQSRMSGMAHIILPDSSISNYHDIHEEYGKFADTAVPAVLSRLLSLGSKKENLVIKIAGGIDVLNANEDSYPFNVGQRNINAVLEEIKKLNLKVNNFDIGGYKSRILKLDVIKGMFYIKIGNQDEVEF